MRYDSDFAAYLAARWPALVRTLVLLGCPQHVAEDVARSALAECGASWDRVRRADDVDAHVYRTLLDCRRDRLRRPWWEEPAPTGTTRPLDDDDRDGPLRRDLEAALDRLTPDLRVVLVLSRVAGLDEEQVAGALALPPGGVARRLERAGALVGERDFRRASEAIDVLAPPSEAVLDRSRRPRRRLRPAVAVAALAVAVLAGLGTWIGTRPPDAAPAPDPPNVTRVENAAGVTWWSRGVLHLRHVQLPMPRIVDLAEVDGGAVVGDEDGAVSFVAADGARTHLGHKVPEQPLVVSDDHAWVAWVDPWSGSPQLIVYDVGARRELAHRALAAEGSGFVGKSHPIALDQDTVFYADQSGDWEWPLPDGAPTRVPQSGLLDVRRAVRVSQPGPEAIRMVQPFFSLAFTRPGLGARISPDGTRVLTRVVLADGGGSVRIYDARSGDRVWRGLRPSETVVAASLGPGDGVTYAIAHSGYLSATYELRTCHLDERSCSTVVTVPQTSVAPVLPR